VLRRFAGGTPRSAPNGLQFAGAAAGGPAAPDTPAAWPLPQGASATAAAAPQVQDDDGFDRAGFERIAKMLFIRLQAANDAGQVDDLRRFTTPELFASLRLDLQDRQGGAQQTDVVQLDAELVERTQEAGQWVASVRFHGLIRENANGGAEPFDELWHFVQPADASREWAIAGIQPSQQPA
jgi:predicted lipid-binding transport protein (Tim44 family)